MLRICGAILFLLFVRPGLSAIPQAGSHAVTSAETKAIVQAIEDEIYDWGCQSDEYEFIGERLDYLHYKVPVYIDPRVRDGQGRVIYKLMPFGEVYRAYWIGKSGGIYLDNSNPSAGFGPERSSYKTLYMDDAELCKDKTEWIKDYFVVSYRPSPELLKESSARQKKRLGETYGGPYKCNF